MTPPHESSEATRREFLKQTASASALLALRAVPAVAVDHKHTNAIGAAPTAVPHNQVYEGATLNRVAFPMGGIGAGTICLDGTGSFSHVSLANRPQLTNEPLMFAAISVRKPRVVSRVLEGPIPGWRVFDRPGYTSGSGGPTSGLGRFAEARFAARFPFATITLTDTTMPVTVELTGWSPFTPGDPDNSCLPVAGLEYRVTNTTTEPVSAVFSFSAEGVMGYDQRRGYNPTDRPVVTSTPDGFVLGPPWRAFQVAVDDPGIKITDRWVRGEWFDTQTEAGEQFASGEYNPMAHKNDSASGATLFVPLDLAPHAERTIKVLLSWYVPESDIRTEQDLPTAAPDRSTYKPWYSGHFASPDELATYWHDKYDELRQTSERFTNCFYDSTLPPEIVSAVGSNLAILKSPTMLRQTDGRLYNWEGSGDDEGLGDYCTHVWNYAQATAHLFPSLERTLRETEFGPSQYDDGNQSFRSGLPIRPIVQFGNIPAADGQLGGIMKAYREWRISGDTEWLRKLWPRIKSSLEFGIRTWDPDRAGWTSGTQSNTYDTEFYGPNGFCTTMYLGALQAGIVMGTATGDDVSTYKELLTKGVQAIEGKLFNGEYFIHIPDPKYPDRQQYATGCMADGVLGSWMALVCGVGHVVDIKKVTSHVAAVHRYNFRANLSDHVNLQRNPYFRPNEGGLIICTWPRGNRPKPGFNYCDEVWTGIEHQVASHALLLGLTKEGLDIVRASRQRYDGQVRNPFNEYEWGSWYGRAQSSYALLQGYSGARYDAVDKVLYLEPKVPGDFRCFLATASGYGTVGVRDGKPFLETKSGTIEVHDIKYVKYTKSA